MIIRLCRTPEAYINQCLFIRRRGCYVNFLHFQFLRPDFLKHLTSFGVGTCLHNFWKSHEIPLDPPPISLFSPIVMQDLYLKTNKLENSGFCTVQLKVEFLGWVSLTLTLTLTQPRGKHSCGSRGPRGSGHAWPHVLRPKIEHFWVLFNFSVERECAFEH